MLVLDKMHGEERDHRPNWGELKTVFSAFVLLCFSKLGYNNPAFLISTFYLPTLDKEDSFFSES